MTRQEEILNYANSFQGIGMENEELKEIIRLAIIDGAMWADNNPNIDAFIEKACEWLENHNDYQRVLDNGRAIRYDMTQLVIDFRKAMKGE